MNELSKIKNCLSVKEKRVNISNSKNRNKCRAKVLALMLSAVSFFPGITPYANSADVKEEAKSENSVVRKIKDAGEYVSSLAKREWIEILNFLKANPKAVTVIATTLVLMTAGTVYREVKSRKELQIVVNENRNLNDEIVRLNGALRELQRGTNLNKRLLARAKQGLGEDASNGK